MAKNTQLLVEEKEGNPIEEVAAYLRVSSSKQDEEGYSLDAQLDSIQRFVNEKGWELPQKFTFKEVKPATRIERKSDEEFNILDSFKDRPQLTELIYSAYEGKFSHLIIYARDRLSRVVEDTIELEMYFKRKGIKVHYIRDGENFDESNSDIERLLHIVFTSLAEMEGNLLSNRVKSGMVTCASKGRWPGGKVPFGYIPKINTNNSQSKKKWYTTLKTSNLERALVEEVFRLYLMGMGYKLIADKMNENYGFITWSKGKIEGIIKNEIYTGKIVWDRRGGRRNPGRKNDNPIISEKTLDNAIISEGTWNKTLDERSVRAKSRDGFHYDTSFILKDKLVCPECKSIMKSRNPGINKTNVYRCIYINKIEGKKCKVIIPSWLVEHRFLEHMRSNFFCLDNIDIYWNTYNQRMEEIISKSSTIENEIKIRIKKYEDFILNINTIVSGENDEYMKKAIHTQRIIANDILDNYRNALKIVCKNMGIKRKTKEELQELISHFLPGIFSKGNDEDLIRVRREFVLNFVDKVEVLYNKEEKRVDIKEVTLLYPELNQHDLL
ncbi:MAG: recombinase family protein [Clostridiaceae bacterium]|nr:recombinase family protein [Clostridiaceae bacterium]